MDEKILYWVDKLVEIEQGRFVGPICCEIDPSNTCPLHCKFCFYKKHLHNNKQNLPLDIYRKLLVSLKSLGTIGITFTGGGEPLANLNFQKMFDLAIDAGFEVGLVTNGVLLDRINGLARFKFIRISLDAATSGTYRKVKGADVFDRVIANIVRARKECETVGLAFVVFEDNRHEMETASKLAEYLRASYIQFKPVVLENGEIADFVSPLGSKIIKTNRWRAEDTLACTVAHLVGVVGADCKVYFCCQHRGNPSLSVGDLKEEKFEVLWEKRMGMIEKINPLSCPQCRYMNYSRVYKDWKSKGVLLMKHKNFL
jgi:MoaA/NifB/PqqE/SkfB family radical SAM enzyme